MLENLVWILKLWPFIREVFIKNEDFRKAVLNNKTLVVLLSTSLLLLMMTGLNARSYHQINIQHQRLVRETEQMKSQYEITLTEKQQCSGQVEVLKASDYELSLKASQQSYEIASLQRRVEELKKDLEYERKR